MFVRFANCMITAMILLALSGCGQTGDGIDRVVVYGNISLQGQPLESGNLMLVPEKGTEAPASGAEIIGGKYRVVNRGGVVPGEYTIRITADKIIGPSPSPDSDAPLTEQLIPKKYNSTSELKLSVPADAKELEANFALEK